MILRLAINVIYLYAVLSTPVIPHKTAEIAALLGVSPDGFKWADDDLEKQLTALKAGTPFTAPEKPLFQKISDEQVAQLSEKYGAPKE